MTQQVCIDINPADCPTDDVKAVFNPSPQTANAGDSIFWRNNDGDFTHQPKPANGADDDWFDTPISKMGNDGCTSSRLTFSAATPPQGVAYVCALHPGEKGTIIVK